MRSIQGMSAGELLRQANQLKRSGKLEEAIALYRQVIDINPHLAWAYHGLGNALAKQGNLDEAVACYSEGLKINTHSAWLFYSLGEALAELGDLEAAVEYLKKAIELQPDCYKFYNTLGWVLMQQKNFDDALNSYNQAIKLNSKVVDAYLGCCALYICKGDLQNAQDYINLATQLNPKKTEFKLYSDFFYVLNKFGQKVGFSMKNNSQNIKDNQDYSYYLSQFLNLVKMYEEVSVSENLMKIRELGKFHHCISELILPGPDYLGILRRLHMFIKPKNYVEIGVETGKSLRLASLSTVAIGIDPQPQLQYKIAPSAKIFQMTSDNFFQNYNLLTELQGQRVDFAFIDGLHLFEQALKDFINLEKYSHSNTVICFHDTFPLDEITARRDRTTGFWSGDVWKVALILRKYRPDLKISTVATQPTGLTIVTNLDSSSKILSKHYDDIVQEYMNEDWVDSLELRSAMLSVVVNDWSYISNQCLQNQKN
ncbi:MULTISPECIES: tetratricopeptide repeat protein [unclassified Limnospira]|uniref:tetratricopeptide repeat protein n=2 Tax=Limnospira TaxID=2596745 RepID=UPI0028E1394C|nr:MULTISPECIES: tetratricopeptide repeat protein [unclassified Limnospira]MDT9204515.1 tetratricopeptide repeat protein [Limnospira sp. PMC 1243.20]MDT9245924.1 tetratricopeptide repeat protein [Limnospira sp. PMC 1249.20]MDT9317171.1 tetratricopeptide repeat protein [Limnospira sp. PMC 1306.21]